jgi:hypothetical protein
VAESVELIRKAAQVRTATTGRKIDNYGALATPKLLPQTRATTCV